MPHSGTQLGNFGNGVSKYGSRMHKYGKCNQKVIFPGISRPKNTGLSAVVTRFFCRLE